MENKGPLFLQDIKRKRLKITPVQVIVLGYLAFAVLGTILLSLPFSLRPGTRLDFIDALFTATSAISVTGLTVVSTQETFSLAGKMILAFLLQFGGIGIMTLGTLVFVLRGNQVSLRERLMIRADQNQTTLQGMVMLMLFIFKIAIAFEILGSLFLTLHFWHSCQMPFLNALGMGVFHSISAFTNAGFDLFGNSLQGFGQDYVVQGVISLLLLAGAIGFPVILDVYSGIIAWRRQKKFKFSLFTKITTVTFAVLLAAGFVTVLLAEIPTSLADVPWHQKISVAFFQSLTTRNSGFSTIDVSVFQGATLLFFCFLMFIGTSPSACGGGIRTTTLAVLVLSVLGALRGQTRVKVFRRELFQEDIMRAFIVFFVGVMLVFGAVIVLLAIEPFLLTEVLFEVCSAFGTTGLSLGITGKLSPPGKAIIIFLMFIGRIGIVSLLLLFQRRRSAEGYHFVKEHIIVGQ
jgi:potassium uptake TrkH family protein